MEDANGLLVAELPGHGLKSLPSGTVDYNSPQDVPIETYSNNLGIYNQVFTINSVTERTSGRGSKQLSIGEVATRNHAPVVRDVPITILAPHVASGDHVDSIMSLYYDGDPDKRGTLFDQQRISRVEPGSPYVDTASYLPKTCGQHEIFVQAIPLDGTVRPATASTTFKVTRDPVLFIDELITYVRKPAFPPFFRDSLVDYLNFVKRQFDKGETKAGTLQRQVLLDLVQSGRLSLPDKVQHAVTDEIKDLLGCL